MEPTKPEDGAPPGPDGTITAPLTGGNGAPARVMCFHMDFEAGGTLYQTFRVLECLQKLGVVAELVCVSEAGPLIDKVPANVKITILQDGWRSRPIIGKLKPLRLALSVIQLGRHARRENPDVVLSCGNKINLIAVLASYIWKRPTRLMLTITNEIYHRMEGARDRKLGPWLIKNLYARADKILTVSDGLKSDLAEMNGKLSAMAETIYPPMDVAKIASSIDEPVDHPWFGARDVPVVLAVGRLCKQKDFDTLIRAMAIVNQTRPARLAIMGPGAPEEMSRLTAMADELGIMPKFEFLGLQHNPYKFMSRADCFALSSLWEGFGIVLAEALACGCPIVSTDCHHGPREILDNGKFGALVPVRDPAALAAAILDTLAKDAPRDGLRERAKLFGYEEMTTRYEAVFRDILITHQV